jgi:hypothetical protein
MKKAPVTIQRPSSVLSVDAELEDVQYWLLVILA